MQETSQINIVWKNRQAWLAREAIASSGFAAAFILLPSIATAAEEGALLHRIDQASTPK
jgi:hypothetical protein